MGAIVVTGATGTVGTAVVQNLTSRGARVRAGSRSPSNATALAELGAEVVELDYGRPATFGPVLEGADRALVVAPDGPEHAEQIARFIDAAASSGLRYVVKVSGLQTAPDISLARWNREAEEAIARSGIDATILRPNSFMQNFSRMLGHAIRSDGVIALPFGTGRVSWIDGRDVGAVAAALLLEPAHVGGRLDLTGTAALSTEDVAAIFSDVLGRPIRYVDVPPEATRQGMAAMGLPDWAVSATAELFEASRLGQMATVSTAVTDILGRAPIGLDAFVRDHRAAFL